MSENTHKACCTLPPVQVDYTPKGSYQSYGGFNRVYITGPRSSETAIICVYDIFGFFPQTRQGADMIADSLNARVLMPDFFEPEGAWPAHPFPPVGEENQKKYAEFFTTTAGQEKANKNIKALAKALQADNASKIAVYGLCWGSKVAINVSGEADLFKAVALIHPALVVADDAKQVKVPLAMYYSKNDSRNDYDQTIEHLKGTQHAAKNDYKYYETMTHGWAGARGDLNNEETRKYFHEVYTKVAVFFSNAFEA